MIYSESIIIQNLKLLCKKTPVFYTNQVEFWQKYHHSITIFYYYIYRSNMPNLAFLFQCSFTNYSVSSTAELYPRRLKYCLGVSPVTFLNCLKNVALDVNPAFG